MLFVSLVFLKAKQDLFIVLTILLNVNRGWCKICTELLIKLTMRSSLPMKNYQNHSGIFFWRWRITITMLGHLLLGWKLRYGTNFPCLISHCCMKPLNQQYLKLEAFLWCLFGSPKYDMNYVCFWAHIVHTMFRTTKYTSQKPIQLYKNCMHMGTPPYSVTILIAWHFMFCFAKIL